MKSVIILAMAIVGLTLQSQAQMASASPVNWTIDEYLTVDINRDSVWQLLKDPIMGEKFATSFVKSIKIMDGRMPIERTVTLKDGSKREETITQMDQQHRFLVYQIQKNSLPSGISAVTIAIFTKEIADHQSEVNWKIKIDGEPSEKARLGESLKSEINAYKEGLNPFQQKN